ncbi:hypothetical protein WUBG_09074 [Wuchereria bancrofti]|uniref:Uncharacterized protein n=1 Tax=Wuchereria bancrofti TaxID=6293 RepID=J9EXW8_WUCBA|nr:hypothetical protein WUBG_09074 [Wuchereria bancrofti]
MSEQSSREIFHVTDEGENTTQQQQTFSQLPQQLRIQFSCQQNVPSLPELLAQEFSLSDSSRQIIENMRADEIHEMFTPSSSSSSAIRQPYLQMILQQALQRIQALQQRYSDRNQFIMQLPPVQANQQQSTTGISQQSNAEQCHLNNRNQCFIY